MRRPASTRRSPPSLLQELQRLTDTNVSPKAPEMRVAGGFTRPVFVQSSTCVVQQSAPLKAVLMLVGLVGNEDGEGVWRKDGRRRGHGEGKGVCGRPSHRLGLLLIVQDGAVIHLRRRDEDMRRDKHDGAGAGVSLPCFG